MAKNNNFHIISIISDNVDIWTEEDLSEKEAEKRYKELLEVGKNMDSSRTLLFIVEGKIKKKNVEVE